MHPEGDKDLVTRRHAVFHGLGITPEGAKVDCIEVRDQRRPTDQFRIGDEKTRYSFQNIREKLAGIALITGDEHQNQTKVLFTISATDFSECRLAVTFPGFPTRRTVMLPVEENDAALARYLVDVARMIAQTAVFQEELLVVDKDTSAG